MWTWTKCMFNVIQHSYGIFNLNTTWISISFILHSVKMVPSEMYKPSCTVLVTTTLKFLFATEVRENSFVHVTPNNAVFQTSILNLSKFRPILTLVILYTVPLEVIYSSYILKWEKKHIFQLRCHRYNRTKDWCWV